MLFDRTRLQDSSARDDESASPKQGRNRETSSRPLVCMIFFFASQMSRNLQENTSQSSSDDGSPTQSSPVHRLDTLLSDVRPHAHRSPYITRFETLPVEMAPPGRPRGTSRESMHDTLLLVNFKNKWAWEQWLQTKEWQRFMERTEEERVFRRMPHVRCASSLQGLRDPLDVLFS